MFVYLVFCESARGREVFVMDSKANADIMFAALKAEGRDPWIVEQAVKGDEFIKFYASV